jgi:hypothetical protein
MTRRASALRPTRRAVAKYSSLQVREQRCSRGNETVIFEEESRKEGKQESEELGCDSSDLQRSLCEVENQPVLEIHRAQIRADDCKVNIFDASQSFELDDDSSFNDEIELMKSNRQATVADSNSSLTIERDAPMIELDAERVVIDPLHEAWAKLPMHLDRGADDVVRELLMRE